MSDTDELIKSLALIPHPEGGFYREIYKSPLLMSGLGYGQPARSICTTILYLLTRQSPIGHLHKNSSDIIHYFHLGSAIQFTTVSPTGNLETFTLGPEFREGHCFQRLVQGGFWKASEILPKGEFDFALISESVSPGFLWSEMELASKNRIRTLFPNHFESLANLILK